LTQRTRYLSKPAFGSVAFALVTTWTS
jgi:hypothetical protein